MGTMIELRGNFFEIHSGVENIAKPGLEKWVGINEVLKRERELGPAELLRLIAALPSSGMKDTSRIVYTRVAISTSGMVFQIFWREGLLESRDVLRLEKWSAHRGRTQEGSEFGDPLIGSS